MDSITSAVLAYVLVQFIIGAWVSRHMRSEQDYILAGRSLGPVMVAFSVFATWFGAEAIQVSAGEIYDKGLAGALVDPIGYGVAVIIVAILVAGPLWRGNVTTYADFMRQRYSPAVEKLFVVVLLPGSLFWAAAQMRAFGQIVSATSGVELPTAILVAAILVAGYSVVGGLLADAITDFIQGLVVIIGLVVLFYFVAEALGGVGAGIARVAPERWQPLAGDDGPLVKLEKIAIVICGSIVAVELISRFLGAKSARVAVAGTLAGGAVYLVVGLIPIYLGLVGPELIKDLKETEQIVPRLAEAHLPRLAYAVFLGALVSAILSVVHAALHAPAAQLSHNIITPLRPQLSPRARLTSVRLTVLALSLVAFGLAHSVERIKELVEMASAFGSAGAFIVAIMGLFTRFGGPSAAVASLLCGVIVWAAGKVWLDLSTPYLAGLAAAFAAYLAVALVEPRKGASRA